jgi:uncharacterized RDD family membrane protein YckC
MNRISLCLVLALCGEFALASWLPAQDPPDETPKVETNNDTSRRAKRPPRRETANHNYHDLVTFGQDVTIKEGEVAHDVVLFGGTAAIDGAVRGDLVVIFGNGQLGPNADIKGDLVIVGGSLEADPSAHVGGDRVVVGLGGDYAHHPVLRCLSKWVHHGLFYGRPLPHQLGWSWIVAGIALLLYLVIAVLFPRQVQAPVTALEEKPGQALLVGFLGMLLTLPLLALLAVTVVGIPVIPFAIVALLVAFLFGRVAVYRYAGQQIGAQLGIAVLQTPLTALVIGALLFCLLYTVPVLGFIVWGVVAPLGLGAVLLAVFKRAPAAASEPVGLAMPATTTTSTPPALLPRVGFWLRLLATLLDFALIALLVGLVLHRPKLFLPLWVAYHVALWSWKGTTLGGIVLGLKIVRTDGSPINFAVALVRALGSFFSAAVLGLGFFWAGWSADKQSWHDKIAGTVVVKYPKGTPLV